MRKGLIVAALLIAVPLSAIAQTDYSVNFMSGQEAVSGSILLIAGASGPLISSDVVSYSLTGTGPDPFSVSGTGSVVGGPSFTAGGDDPALSALTIQNGDILFTAAPYVTAGPTSTEDLNNIDQTSFSFVRFESPDPLAGSIEEDGGYGMQLTIGKYNYDTFYLGFGQVLATSAAPEIDPGGTTGALTLLAGVALMVRGRRQRAM